MAAPDLSTPEGRKAYAAELNQVARPWRLGGLGLVVLSILLIAWNRSQGAVGLFAGPVAIVADVMFVLGWALAIVAIVKRTRWHKARLAEAGAGDGAGG